MTQKIVQRHRSRCMARRAAPWLTVTDLHEMDEALLRIRDGKETSTGFYPRRYPVNKEMTLATGFPWTNR